MAEDSDKTELWACTYVVVCSGEQGEDILQQAGMLDPEKSKWQRGNIVETPTKTQPRSYRVQLPSGQRFQGNRRHIRSDRCTEGGDEDTEDPRKTLPRRSGRDRHFPSRLHYDRLGKPTIQ
ncbi:hypothetical protein CAPTEDRAFT_207587 [Capitella teleta]|uniref:Uncharacterized protein n=1 Tax=Capitella teleta TaxID=283909 RepID=R7T3L9_CAPTE|nr:hypothetical protein CAPTEDRAFT_207587 [Capitella teleta]|eukprot:ELT87382.1 hypothetical protein CAPTEDRAFT_207587 [Capitella teleta]